MSKGHGILTIGHLFLYDSSIFDQQTLTYLLLILSVTDCNAIFLIRQARNCVQKTKANDRLRHQRSVQRADKLCAFVAKRPREEERNFNSPSPTLTVPTAVEKGCKSFSQVGT